ncbi:radical SAM protein [Sideroxydans lithotrophicus]|uniref:Radical SAM domain-containing protein n=1 Tax=Sideroxydans lithotrophicus (strain ES-1) TaxID=580332 RepID=D5CLI1_SIDLE|nr:radical SAM protein [Sideroxydans lithotrophicus]ADE10569.1 radical SAM domain-containing protein [Sideroxydans lithotrophicus ES-1]
MSEDRLSVTDHSRDSAGLRYVYPVVSRRAGGVSIGINLNPNNACNWRCIYCQVPELIRGTAPPVDLALLEKELDGFLHELQHGDFMRRVPPEARRINDIALSGNGEPTSAQEFAEVIELIARYKPAGLKLVLITNGSLMQRDSVQQGLRRMAQLDGEVWFKLDRASEAGMALVNDTRLTMDRVSQNLTTAISCCPNTWLQTCWFALDGAAPGAQDEDDYVDFLKGLLRGGIRPQGVLLYGLARPSMQPEAARLSALPAEWLEAFGARIRALGIEVRVSA